MKDTIGKKCSNCRYREKKAYEYPCSSCMIMKAYGVWNTKWKPLSWWQKAAERISLFF